MADTFFHLLRGLLAVVIVGMAPASTLAQTSESTATAPTLQLTAAQRSAIYNKVSRDKTKVAPKQVSASVGADVPPMIELYALPDDILAENPAAEFYKYTVVADRVVLVDPTKMRIVAVIGPRRLE